MSCPHRFIRCTNAKGWWWCCLCGGYRFGKPHAKPQSYPIGEKP